MYKLLKNNGTSDRLKIEWRDQSCMKLEVVGIGQQNMYLIYEKRDCINEFLKCELFGGFLREFKIAQLIIMSIYKSN